MSASRLVAVLGYSKGRGQELHSICAARVARAEEEVLAGDAVLLSGWARKRSLTSEAELMARAWSGRQARVLLDGKARSTYGNALATASAARALAADEVVLVTSGWHGRRASALLRAALRGSGRRVTLAADDNAGTAGTRFR